MAAILAPTIRLIIDELKKAPFLMIDETPYPYKKKKAYVWVVRTDTAALVVPAPGRGTPCAPLFLHELRHMPVVVDGYAVYKGLFNVIQRCWAHVLLKSEEAYIRCKDPAAKEVHKELYHRLCNIHRRAKKIAESTAHLGGANTHTCLELEKEVAGIVAAYGGDSFATHLENAMVYLFTFLRHPGMPSTNNKTEQDIRDAVVIQRKFRQKFVTAEGMQVFSILMSFHRTCHKLNTIPSEMFGRIFKSPDFDFMSYGLSILKKALPAPSSDEGVEPGGDHTVRGETVAETVAETGTTRPGEGVEPGGERRESTITSQSKDTGELTTKSNQNHSGTGAALTTRLDRIMVTIAMVVAVVCDITNDPTRPSRSTCGTTARTDQNMAPPKPIMVPCGKPPPT